MPRGSPSIASICVEALPLVPMLAGLVLSAVRFRAGDALGGILVGEAGMLLSILAALRKPKSDADRP
jgi:hypothetical protein